MHFLTHFESEEFLTILLYHHSTLRFSFANNASNFLLRTHLIFFFTIFLLTQREGFAGTYLFFLIRSRRSSR
jgi:hypothetical protein